MPAAVHQSSTVGQMPGGAGADSASTGAWPATASAQVNTGIGTRHQSRPGAVRADSAPRPRARYASAGRDEAQAIWQRPQARVTASAGKFADHAQDDPGHSGTVQPRTGTPVAVTVSRAARAGEGWLAPLRPHRLDYVTVRDPIDGRRVDDVPVQPLPAASAAR